MRKLIAATAVGTVLACSPAFAQGVGFCDPRHSLKTWVESAPSGVKIDKLSRAGTEAVMEVIKEPISPLFSNTVGAVLIVVEGSPVGVVAFYDDRGCIVDTLHANAADILLRIGDAAGEASSPAADAGSARAPVVFAQSASLGRPARRRVRAGIPAARERRQARSARLPFVPVA
jgi:hypothetical protein